MESHSAELSALLDRQGIVDVVIRYATGVDSRDWSIYRSCFTDPVEVDFSSWQPGLASTFAVDAWVDAVRNGLGGFDSTQHMSTNHVVDLQGDDATCVSYVQARHFLEGELYTLGGHYTNDLVRTDEGWRIRRCRLTVTWQDGDRTLFERAVARAQEAGNAS